jgi:Zn-dependent protease/CBS domain-containing protein
VAGIGIYVHWTFLILLGFIVYLQMRQEDATVLKAAVSVVFVLVLFGCVVLHELGHALTARRFGIHTLDITLLPIGGVARLERMPDDPIQELLVALAGPAVNVVIAGLLAVALLAMGALASVFDMGTQSFLRIDSVAGFLLQLLVVNVILVVFNMLPAFPMDGGRVLRALLATQLSYVQATHIAALVGQAMAIFFFVAGLFTGALMLMFIAIFVYLGAQAEARSAELRSVFLGVSVGDAMVTRFQTLSPDDPIEHATDELLAGHQHDFPVVVDGQVIGILSRSDIVSALSKGGENHRVGDVMRPDCQLLDESERLDRAVARMQQLQCSTLPVVRQGKLVGLLTSENIGEWAMIQAALRDRRRHPAA